MGKRPKVFLPYRGEFGFVVMAHSPQVYAHSGPKIACIEEGNEALYPGCQYEYVTRREDCERRARNEPGLLTIWADEIKKRYPNATLVFPDSRAKRKYFIPQPHESVCVEPADVVVCPRYRMYGANKNWAHWPTLIKALQGEGLKVFAAGAPDSSGAVRCPKAWDYKRYLDASIAAMHAAKLVISTDAGLAHLAVVCGRPLALITHGKGLVADGKCDKGKPYWPVKMDKYYHRENHTGSEIRQIHHAWHGIDRVMRVVREML